jgi:hypothetical protein
MSNDPLVELIEEASGAAEGVFMRKGVFLPLWHMITADGQHVFSGPLSNHKDFGVALIKALMLFHKVVRYVFVDEAWILDRRHSSIDKTELARINRDGLADHPERQEVLMFSAEDQTVGMRSARRAIIRRPGRKATLGPLIIDPPFDLSEGRMVGLLPKLGATVQ